MITINELSMRGRLNFIPKEVKEWLVERDNKWSDINFEINWQEPYQREKEDYERFAKECSLIFYFHLRAGGVKYVSFPYIEERWFIRIKGNALSAFSKNKIANMPEESSLKVLADGIKGIRRSKDNPALCSPKEMVPFILNVFFPAT